MDGLTVRQAQHSDYQAVMDINQNVSDGRDYMEYMYHHFIQHAHCYVAQLHSRVVGFVSFYPVVGERRVVSMAGRTHKQIQGQHLMHHMAAIAMEHLLQRYPNIERVSWATMSADTRTRRAQDPKYGIIPARTWDYLLYQVPLPNNGLTRKLSTVSFSKIEQLDKAGIQGLPTANMDTLFGGYPYIEGLLNWFPLSVSKQSLEWIEREGHLAVSPSSTLDGSTEYNMLSHSNAVTRVQGGVVLRIHMRHNKPDIHTELQHILYHIHSCIQKAPASGIFAIVVNLGRVGDRQEMKGLLQGYLGQPITQGQAISGDTLVEGHDTTSKL